MYKKRKNITTLAVDEKLAKISEDLLTVNPDIILGISKKFILNKENGLDKEIKGNSVILSNTKIEDIIIPSPYRLIGKNNIGYWFDEDILATIIYMNMTFHDGKKIKNLYLDLDEKELAKCKDYKNNG